MSRIFTSNVAPQSPERFWPLAGLFLVHFIWLTRHRVGQLFPNTNLTKQKNLQPAVFSGCWQARQLQGSAQSTKYRSVLDKGGIEHGSCCCI